MGDLKSLVRGALDQVGLLPTVKRVRQAILPPAQENTGLCWFCEDSGFHTRAYVYNYWAENYRIDRPVVRYRLLRADGSVAGTGAHRLGLDETAVFDSRDLVARHRLALPFEGSLLLTIRHPRLVSRRPLQFNTDFFYGNGGVSSVHGQGMLWPKREGEVQTFQHVRAGDGVSTVMVIQNCLDARRVRGVQTEAGGVVTVHNFQGQERCGRIAPMPPLAVRRIDLGEMFPDLKMFLNGSSGSLDVALDVRGHRLLTYVEHRAPKRLTVAHGNVLVLRSSDPAPTAMNAMGFGPQTTVPLLLRKSVDTRYVFFNGQKGQRHVAHTARLYDTRGRLVGELPQAVSVPPGATVVVYGRELLKALGWDGEEFEGIAAFRLSSPESDVEMVRALGEVVVELVDGVNIAGVLLSADLTNCPWTWAHMGVAKRTKIFSRVLFDNEYRSEIWLFHPSSDPSYKHESSTTVKLFGRSGSEALEAHVRLEARSSAFLPLERLFPNVREFLSRHDGIGQIKVRDVTCHLTGIHFVRHVRTGAIAIDHLFGG